MHRDLKYKRKMYINLKMLVENFFFRDFISPFYICRLRSVCLDISCFEFDYHSPDLPVCLLYQILPDHLITLLFHDIRPFFSTDRFLIIQIEISPPDSR